MRFSCQQRVDAEEWVDDPALSVEDTRDTLLEQAVINRLIGGGRATLAHAFPLLKTCASDPIQVLDAASGGADLSRRLVDRARRQGRRIEVTALDLGRKTIGCARQLSAGYPEISFVRGNALELPFPPGAFDLVMASTFIHHLPPEQVIVLLQGLQGVSRGSVIVADLVRSALAYLEFWIFAHLMRFNPVTIHDGLVSVCRSYTPAELAGMAQQAGLKHWKLYRHPIYRMALVYEGKDSA